MGADSFPSNGFGLGGSASEWAGLMARKAVRRNRQEHRHPLGPSAGGTSLVTCNHAITAPERPSLRFRQLGRCDACGKPFKPRLPFARRHTP